MVPRPAHLKDLPSDEELLTNDERRGLMYMRLKRYCFIGAFEPVRTRLPLPKVSDVYATLNKYCERMDPTRFLRILRTATQAKLFRRDEVTLLHAIYLIGDTHDLFKTKVREDFLNLIKTDVDLFLFCKYAAAVHKFLNRKLFCKSIKKAITSWYVSKTSKELGDLFRTNRGRNGFTHSALIHLCHIPDHVLGSKYIYQMFKKSCTTLLVQKDVDLPPKPKPKLKRLKSANIDSKITVVPSTSAAAAAAAEAEAKVGATVKVEADEAAAAKVAVAEGAANTKKAKAAAKAARRQQRQNPNEPMISIPPKECSPKRIRAQVLAISDLRVNKNPIEALNSIGRFQFTFENLPYELLQNPEVLNKVIPSMSCEKLLECFSAPKLRMLFYKPEVLKECRHRFLKKNALINENIDPIMCLMNLDNLQVQEPIKTTCNKKTGRGHIVQFSKVLFRDSFKHTKPMNLNIHITINMQDHYMKRILRNTNTTCYKHAAMALAFTFFKAEENCDVFRWCENEHQLVPVEFKKNFHYLDAFNQTHRVICSKNKQHLWLPMVDSLKRKEKKKYDLFICIVPSATRGNKKHCSEYLAEHLARYRRACENRARISVVNFVRKFLPAPQKEHERIRKEVNKGALEKLLHTPQKEHERSKEE